MDTLHNYYQLLHVQADAPTPVIKASYRAMMQKMRNHPDLGGDPAHAQRLNQAVEVLCDPVRRAAYDRQLEPSAHSSYRSSGNGAGQDSSHHSRSSSKQYDKRNPEREPHNQSAGSQTADDQSADKKTTSRRPAGSKSKDWQATEEHEKQGNCHENRDLRQVDLLLPTRPSCLFCKATFADKPKPQLHYDVENQCHQCQAPTTRIERLDPSDSEELRRIYRHSHLAGVRLWTQWPLDSVIHARVTDLSLAGCAIESDQSLEVNAKVLLDTDTLKAICQVRYCQHPAPSTTSNTWSIGLAFMTLQIKASPGALFSAIA